MDFKEATDLLTDCPTAHDLAQVLGVSLPAVRQARMSSGSLGYRNPPPGWEKAVAKLARQRARELLKLADSLERQS